MGKKLPSVGTAEYLELAAQMRAFADRTFDPQIAAEYLALAAKYLRLAEETQRHLDVIDRTERETDEAKRN